MKWDIGVGDNGALRFVQSRLREALEVARTTRHTEAVYFTELAYLAISEMIREDAARQLPNNDPRVPDIGQLGKTVVRRKTQATPLPRPGNPAWDDN